MSWIKLNEFEIFNQFELMKITLKNVLRIVLRTCKTVSRKPCINIEDKNESPQFSYTYIVEIITWKLLAVVTLPSIYHDCSTWRKFWEE